MTIPTVVLEATALTTEIRCWRCDKMLAHIDITEGRLVIICPRCKAKNTVAAGGPS